MKKNCARMTLLALLLRLWSWNAPGAVDWRQLWDSGALAEGIVAAELGWRWDKPRESAEPSAVPTLPEAAATPAPTPPEAPSQPVETLPDSTEGGESPAAESGAVPASPTPRALSFSQDSLTNRSSQSVDLYQLRCEPLVQRLPADAPQILILHTHATEAYTMDEGHRYTESDVYRSTDTTCNVVRVGDELAAALSEQGFRVIHDRTLCDYPSYTSSYVRSAGIIEQWLKLYPSIAVVIDLHRDALGEGDTVYKTQCQLNGEDAAQVMFVVGTGENGLAHPRWRENLKLALCLQDAMATRFPGLTRPIDLVSERYNQHYTTGSLILEVGSSGNTLPEALRAVRAFAEAAGPSLASLVDG